MNSMKKKKSDAGNRKMKKQRLMDEAKLQKQMQNYFIKPSNVGVQNQPEKSPHFSRQASSLMDIDDHAEPIFNPPLLMKLITIEPMLNRKPTMTMLN